MELKGADESVKVFLFALRQMSISDQLEKPGFVIEFDNIDANGLALVLGLHEMGWVIPELNFSNVFGDIFCGLGQDNRRGGHNLGTGRDGTFFLGNGVNRDFGRITTGNHTHNIYHE